MSDNIEIQEGKTSDKKVDRANQVSKTDSEYKHKPISIIDVDMAIMSYLEEIGLYVEKDGKTQQVPVMYGNPERWQQATKTGYIKDQKGQIQLPLMLFKRNNLAEDSNIIRKFNRNERITYTTGYSNKNRFDKFSQQVGLKPTQEIYMIRVGDHVELQYEFIIWTDFVTHMNQIIEQLNWNSNEYWGGKETKKFKSSIDSFSTSMDTAKGVDRMVKTTFTLNVKGYLLPESVRDSEMDEVVKKGYTTQKVVILNEIETGVSDINSLEELDEIIKNNRK